MNLKKLILPISLVLVIAACNPLKQVQGYQTSMEQAYETKDYPGVLTAYNQLEKYHSSKGSKIKPEFLKKAGHAAMEIENYDKAEEILLKSIAQTDDIESVEMLANVYQQTGKTDKEYHLWIQYADQIKSEEKKAEVSQKLFAIEMQRKEYEKALDRAKKMPSLSDPRFMFMRVEALNATGKKEEAREVCNNLLEKNPDFKPAMEWKAIDIVERAENWYKAEMAKYNKDQNYTAYVYLKRELKKISSMYRQSRELFEKLHEEDPDNQQYIKYLKNIYLRLDMKGEASKMDMLLENQR
jgi:tetratricopeptide (TPR) repeat protein